MNPSRKRNTGHSVYQRLLNHAKNGGKHFNFVLLSLLQNYKYTYCIYSKFMAY